MEINIKSLGDLDKAITKVIYNWETLYLKFDIQFKKKEKMYRPLNIFQAKEIGKESWELFTNIWFDGNKEKLIFTQKTHNGTKTFEIGEFELDKKISIHVTTSNIYVDDMTHNYNNPDPKWGSDKVENKLKSKSLQITIDDSYTQLFTVTDFKLTNRPLKEFLRGHY